MNKLCLISIKQEQFKETTRRIETARTRRTGVHSLDGQSKKEYHSQNKIGSTASETTIRSPKSDHDQKYCTVQRESNHDQDYRESEQDQETVRSQSGLQRKSDHNQEYRFRSR